MFYKERKIIHITYLSNIIKSNLGISNSNIEVQRWIIFKTNNSHSVACNSEKTNSKQR